MVGLTARGDLKSDEIQGFRNGPTAMYTLYTNVSAGKWCENHKIWSERVRGGSPRAHTLSERSYTLQDRF